MSLTFIVGTAADVFGGPLGRAIEAAIGKSPPRDGEEPYRSEPIAARGWRELQTRVLRTLDLAPQLTSIDAYQAVYLPASPGSVEHVPVANLADPLQVGSLGELLEELARFAASASLPTDDVELMQLAAHYLELEDPDTDLDVQTYVQLMLTAKQALARQQALWVVT